MQHVLNHTLEVYRPDGLRFDAAGHSDQVRVLLFCGQLEAAANMR
jgi:hypothetical protein